MEANALSAGRGVIENPKHGDPWLRCALCLLSHCNGHLCGGYFPRPEAVTIKGQVHGVVVVLVCRMINIPKIVH